MGLRIIPGENKSAQGHAEVHSLYLGWYPEVEAAHSIWCGIVPDKGCSGPDGFHCQEDKEK
jgi:hypothetical protein